MENQLFALVCLLWGSGWMFIKIGLSYFPPFTFGALRYSIAALVLYIVMRINHLSLPTRWEDAKPAVVFGILNGLSGAMLNWGGQFLSSTLTSMMNTTTPFFMAIYAYFLLDEKFDKYKIIGLFMGFAGLMIIFSGGSEIYADSFWGAIAVVIQSAIYALAATYSKKYKVDIKPMQVVTVQLMSAGLVMTLLGILFERNQPIIISTMGIISLLYLSIFAGALAFLIYYYLLTRIDVVRISYTSFITPIVATIEGVVFLNDSITLRMILGLILTLCGAYITNILSASTQKQESSQ